MGRVFMTAIDDPFRVALDEIEAVRDEARVIFVDFHAEATSEKVAMGWHLDGRVTAVVGTHTHVQTADARVLPQGTAYITDVGMTGPHDSVIGVERAAMLAALPDRPAAAVRDGHRKPAAERASSSTPTRRPAAPLAIERLEPVGRRTSRRSSRSRSAVR